MRLTRLYVDAPLAPGSIFELPAEPAAHVVRVLRAREGDAIVLFNGDGREFDAVVGAVRGSRIGVTVGDARGVHLESPLKLTLLQCVPRGDRMDWIIQKATELGVTRIVPLLSGRSVVRLEGRQAESKVAHWRAVAASACEQCGRCRLPTIDAPLPLIEYLGAAAITGLRLVLDPEAETGMPNFAETAAIDVAVGPEGGFTAEESEALRITGYAGVRLGPRILRTETAAIAAVVWLQTRLGDMVNR